MKKVILILAAAASFTACKDTEPTNTTDNMTGDTVVTNDPMSNTTPPASTPYTVTEGDIMRKGGVIVVYENSQWVPVTGEVNLADGTVVTQRGEVKRDGRMVKLEEGYTVSRTGAFFDRAGAAIENAWDATKDATKEAAQDIKQGTKNAMDNTKEAVRDARNNMRDTTRNKSGL